MNAPTQEPQEGTHLNGNEVAAKNLQLLADYEPQETT